MLCPICKKPVPQTPPPDGGKSHLPFCSERCKLIDLGRWLSGSYQIPVDPTDATNVFERPDDDNTPDDDERHH